MLENDVGLTLSFIYFLQRKLLMTLFFLTLSYVRKVGKIRMKILLKTYKEYGVILLKSMNEDKTERKTRG